MKQFNIEKLIQKNAKLILVLSILLMLILALLTFDVKVSVGGDDSWYIVSAKQFLEGIRFPAWHGSLYSIFLSPFVALFGMNVVLFKMLSIVLMLLQVYILAKLLKQRVPWLVWAFTIIFTSVNMQNIVYAGTTYSEAMFVFVQALVFLFLYKAEEAELKDRKQSIIAFLLLGFSMFLLVLTRNVGFGVLIAVFLYFLLRGQYLKSILSLASFMVYQFPFSLYKKHFWDVKDVGFETQLSAISRKDFYHPDKGSEDLMGFVVRFWENAQLYLSKHLMKFLGFKDLASKESSALVTILIIALFIVVTIYVIRRKREFLFPALYLAILISGTFIAVQAQWDQERLILIYLPIICFYLGTGLHAILGKTKLPSGVVLTVFFSLIIGLNLKNNLVRMDANQVYNNLKGDQYYGFTPDWKCYLSMCEWTKEGIEEDALIACRKPSMAQIYGERDYHGLYRVNTNNSDSMRAYFESKNVDYVIAASLRIDPKRRTDRVISTVRNSLKILVHKHPYALEHVHSIGSSEASHVFKLHLAPEKLNAATALKRLKSAHIIAPENPKINYDICVQLIKSAKYKEALKYVNAADKSLADNAEIKMLKGIVFYNMKNYKKAIEQFNFVIKKSNSNVAWYNLAISYYQMKDPVYREYAQKAKELGYPVPPALFN